ncbi:hypothetical protein [Nonomuraea sp. NEAU-A123]|nr:hypothetical protein [Nonomuraea sp. NEAU-A123]MBT2232267.1 hypothetical protein [Nonomuraea sp. NEAU-A123]
MTGPALCGSLDDGVLYYVESNPAMSRMSLRTLERILADKSLARHHCHDA